jgi:hypothetical protein
MAAPETPSRRSAALRLTGIGVLAGAVVATLIVIGRVHTVNPAFSLFGRQYVTAVTLKALLATFVLGAAALQVLLALWMYRKLPFAGSAPRPVPAGIGGWLQVSVYDSGRGHLDTGDRAGRGRSRGSGPGLAAAETYRPVRHVSN